MNRRYILFPYLLLFSFFGGVLGLRAGNWYGRQEFVVELAPALQDFSIYAITLLGALVGLLTASLSFSRFVRTFSGVEKAPFSDKMAGGVGLLFGCLVGAAFVAPFGDVPISLKVGLLVLSAILGINFALSMKHEIGGWFSRGSRGQASGDGKSSGPAGEAVRKIPPKLLDTNVIIDGRIADICNTGFVEGALVVPQFVLQELQSIADSENSLRRARGRRGLVMLARMQKELGQRLQVMEDYDVEFEAEDPVDVRLVKLGKSMEALLLTNDFNLNKVAELHRVPVLNVNELANALKPVFLPGETLAVEIVRAGKSQGQGVGYLDDGTMVVVDGGERKIGSQVECTVTSVLQTVAGKMIFADLGTNGRPRGGRSR